VRIIETAENRVRWVVPSGAGMAVSSGQPLDTVAQRVAGGLAALADHRFGSWMPIAAITPPTFRAFQEFDRATDLKMRNRPREALSHYESAAALDPAFTWSMMEAAVAHMSVGDRPGADSIVEVVNIRRDELPAVQRRWLEWMLAVRDEDWVRSYAALERAAQLIPERFLYGLAENARWLNRPRRSVELLTRLGPDGPAGRGFGYWYLMADSYHQLREHARELDVALQARRRYSARPTAVIVEARARAALGDVAGAVALADTILALPRDGRDTPGTFMLQTAEELRAHGHAAAAVGLIDRAILWFATRPPDEAASLDTRRQFARVAYVAGRWSLADSLFRELLRDDRDGVADHRAMLGAIAAHRGDTTEAKRWVSVLRELARSVNRPREDAIFGQARIMAVLGDAAESVRLLREALGGQGQDLHTEADFAGLAADSAFQRFVRPKG
jgi:tetratricopeptide (TPR) repeat protein